MLLTWRDHSFQNLLVAGKNRHGYGVACDSFFHQIILRGKDSMKSLWQCGAAGREL